jgi:hypothetical protein
LQHVQFSDRIRGGSFRLWTGDDGYEEAEFLFELNWKFRESDQYFSLPIFDLPLLCYLCYLLGVKMVRTFRIPAVSLDEYGFRKLWNLLKKLSAMEKLAKLCTDAVGEF